jgi:hypothetical protein
LAIGGYADIYAKSDGKSFANMPHEIHIKGVLRNLELEADASVAVILYDNVQIIENTSDTTNMSIGTGNILYLNNVHISVDNSVVADNGVFHLEGGTVYINNTTVNVAGASSTYYLVRSTGTSTLNLLGDSFSLDGYGALYTEVSDTLTVNTLTPMT